MQLKFAFNQFVNLIIGILIFFLLVLVVSMLFRPKSSVVHSKADYRFIVNSLRPIDPLVSVSLPYTRYVKVKDSIATIRKLKNAEIKASGFEVGFPFFGTYTALYINLNKPFPGWENVYKRNEKRYFLKLPGWKLRPSVGSFSDSITYYVANEKSFIRKVVWDNEVKTSSGKPRYNGHYADISVKFNYIRNESAVLIPVSRQANSLVKVLLAVSGFTGLIYFLYFIVGGFIKFLYDVSKGHSFTRQNISRLRLIAFSLFAYPVVIFIMNRVMRLIFSDYFTEDIVLHDRIWKDQWKTALVGLIVFAVYRAFKQGLKLKEEQELTI